MRRWLCWNYGGEDDEELRDEDEEGKGKGCTKFGDSVVSCRESSFRAQW